MIFWESDILKSRFLEKGYEEGVLDQIICDVGDNDRKQLLCNNSTPRNTDSFSLMFLPTYFCQHYAIKKYWPALKNYWILGPNLPDQSVIFRGSSSLKNRVAPNVADPWRDPALINVEHVKSKPLRGQIYQTSQLLFFYILLYEERGILDQRPMWFGLCGPYHTSPHNHLGEHITNICKGFPGHSVSIHYAEKHNKNPRWTTFIALEKYIPDWSGNNARINISRS